MAGLVRLVPAIHVFIAAGKTWRPGTGPGMTSRLARRDLDVGALRAAFTEAIDNRTREQRLLVDMAVEALERISPAGRQQLIRHIERR
jgi:hypothetical protein